MRFWHVSVVLFVVGAGAPHADARLAGVAEVPFVVELDRTEIVVEKDGRSTLSREALIRIVNDQGRESQSVQSLSFNSRAQTFQIVKAETINLISGKEVRTSVPARDIEIKEVGEMSQAFDSVKQASVSFPKVRVGSKLYLKYVMKNLEVPIKGFWSIGFSISGETFENFQVHVHSRLPLYFGVHDSKNRFQTSLQKAKADDWSDLDIRSSSPIFSVVTQEENPFTSPDRTPSISISTLPGWSQYAHGMVAVHEDLLKAPLPAALLEIKGKAELQKTALDRIQSVAASVAQEFRYFGDWRRRHGGVVPRSLEEIAESRYGDCKDLAMAVTAVYRALGYKANLAWIYRGDVAPPTSAYDLPVDANFNHAISRVEAEGQVYWIDATDPVAFARGTYTDIADRPTYVLDASGGRLERTPRLLADDALFESHLAYELQSDESLKVSGQIKMAGRTAIGLTARAFYSPVEAVNYEIIRLLSNNGKVSDSVVGGFERGSRVVQDVTIPVQFRLAEIGLRTSAGLGFPLFRDDSVGRLMIETKDRDSDLFLEAPNRSRTVLDLLNVRRVGRSSLDCDLKSEFLDLRRQVVDIGNGVSMRDEVIVKKAIVDNETLKSESFAKFQKEARSCFNRAAVIIERR